MHEYSLMQGVIQAVLEQLEAPGANPAGVVQEIILKVGALDVHSEEACQQAYEMLAPGTSLAQARLRVVVLPATVQCPSCGYQGSCAQDSADDHDPIPCVECPRCGAIAAVVGGRGVESVELIVEGAAP